MKPENEREMLQPPNSEFPDREDSTPQEPQSGIQTLWESRPAVWCVLAFCVLSIVASLISFVVQFTSTDPSGNPYRDQPGAWPNMGGNILWVLIGLGLATCLWHYLKILREKPESPRELFQAISNWWTLLAYGLFLTFLYRSGSMALLFFLASSGTGNVAEPPGYRPDPNGIPRIQVQFRLAEDEPGPGLIEAIAPDLQKVYLHPEVLITNADITETHVAPSETAEHPVLIVLRPEARTKVKVATRNHTGKPLVILFNGTVYKIANVNGPFSSPIELSGRYSQQEAEQIARGLVGGG